MTGPIATILAAVISAVGALIAARFDDFKNLFRRPSRNIRGEWEGKSFPVVDGKIQDKPTSEYVVKLTQSGEKVTGVMTQIKVSQDTPSVFKWSGKILNDYFMYESLPTADTKFFISSGLLNIHPAGAKMSGYVVANAQPNEAERTRIRFTELTCRK